MKIRTDFVTNSSSVSFIITMDRNIVDECIKYFGDNENMKGRLRMAKALKNFMEENGTINYLHEHEIFTCLMEFRTDDGTAVTKKILEMNGDNTDPLKMNEEDLFNYIRGEFICQQKLSGFFDGFGATKVEQY